MQKIGKVKGFAPKYDINDDHIVHSRSFDLKGNSNGVEFSVYDKEAESERKDAKGILRVEVRLAKPKAIGNYTDETVTSKRIESLASNSREIFLSIFTYIVPFGNHYKKKQAVQLIQENIHKKVPREKMIRLVELIPKKKSLYLAQKEMDDRNINKVMKMFVDLNLSPVTISKRHDIKFLKTLYCYLLDD